MISAVIFDLDGLLSDTEQLHRRAYQDVLGRFDITLTEAAYAEHWTRLGRGIVELLSERGLDLDLKMISDQKSARYRELVATSVRPMPGALEVLRRLRGHKTLALASSGHANAVECVIRALGMAEYFPVVVSREDVARVKPFPDLFLLAARRLAVKPAACVVLEDAEKGVIAANEAGMKCVAIPNEDTHHNDFSRASAVVSSLDEVTIEMIDSLDGHSKEDADL